MFNSEKNFIIGYFIIGFCVSIIITPIWFGHLLEDGFGNFILVGLIGLCLAAMWPVVVLAMLFGLFVWFVLV